MKLPDFRNDKFLNDVKNRMGIKLNHFAKFNVGVADLFPFEEKAISEGVGIDVGLEDIVFEGDGTFSFKGVRVVIHIRDVADYGRNDFLELPRYHVLQCRTIREKKDNGTFNRYVVNAEPTGRFQINIIKNNRKFERFENLRVCQNCLAEVKFWGFSYEMTKENRDQIVSLFMPRDFFEAFPMQLFEELPTYDVESYPDNTYSKDFAQVAERIKRIRNFTCEDCGDLLKDKMYRKYLQVHHINHQKSDNTSKNLRVLCYACHAKIHSHMKNKELHHYLSLMPRPEKSPFKLNY